MCVCVLYRWNIPCSFLVGTSNMCLWVDSQSCDPTLRLYKSLAHIVNWLVNFLHWSCFNRSALICCDLFRWAVCSVFGRKLSRDKCGASARLQPILCYQNTGWSWWLCFGLCLLPINKKFFLTESHITLSSYNYC